MCSTFGVFVVLLYFLYFVVYFCGIYVYFCSITCLVFSVLCAWCCCIYFYFCIFQYFCIFHFFCFLYLLYSPTPRRRGGGARKEAGQQDIVVRFGPSPGRPRPTFLPPCFGPHVWPPFWAPFFCQFQALLGSDKRPKKWSQNRPPRDPPDVS